MMKVLARSLVAVAVFFLIFAQNILAQDEGNVVINSNPQGSMVTLRGELDLSGVTPVRFSQRISGRYDLEVVRDGYETYHSVNYFSELQPAKINIMLVPKTRTKAVFRSMIIPGWGQKYYGSSLKAALYFVGTIGAVTGYVIARDDYDNKVDTYHERLAAWSAETNWGERSRLYNEVYSAQKKANDAEDMVNLAASVAIGIYALNVLDAFLFFPDFTSYTEYEAITLKPEAGRDAIGFRFAVKF